jgi:hypothetical protein
LERLWIRHGLLLCTRSQMAWWNDTWRRLRGNWGRSFRRTRDWDGKLPIFVLACRASTHVTTGATPASMGFGRKLLLPCDLLFGASPTSSSLWAITSWTSKIGYMTSITTPVNIWRWPATGRRHWPTPQDSRRGKRSGCTIRPGPQDSHLISSYPGKARIRWSPGLTKWSTRCSDTRGRRLWWYTKTDWRHV